MQKNPESEFVVGAMVDAKPGARLTKINPHTGELYAREPHIERHIRAALPGRIEDLDDDHPGQVYVGGWLIHTECLRIARD